MSRPETLAYLLASVTPSKRKTDARTNAPPETG